MRREYLPRSLIQQLEIGQTSSGAAGVLHDAPDTFTGVEVVPTRGREDMEAPRAMVVVECRVELVRSMAPAAIDHHHDVLVGLAAGRQHLLAIWAQCLGSKVGHDCRADCGSPILDRPHDTAPHAAGDTTPGAIPHPRLACEGFGAFALTRAQGAEREASTQGLTPPAGAGQGQAPEDGVGFIEPNDLTTARPGLQGRQGERALGERSWGGIEPPGGAVGAYFVLFNAPRTLSRLRETPVWWAKTVASS